VSVIKIIIHTALDGDYICAARAAAHLMAHPDFHKEGIVMGENGKAFFVCRNKSGSVTVRGQKDYQDEC
jgi:hypothetical protein